jgi:hypothetical protein
MYSKVHIGKHLSDNSPIQNGLKQGDALSPLLLNFALEQWSSTWGTRRHLREYKKTSYINQKAT